MAVAIIYPDSDRPERGKRENTYALTFLRSQGQTRSFGDVGSMSGLRESGHVSRGSVYLPRCGRRPLPRSAPSLDKRWAGYYAAKSSRFDSPRVRNRKSGIGPGSPGTLPTLMVKDNRGLPICRLGGGQAALPLAGSLSRGRLASAIEIANRLAASRSGADSRGMDTGSSRYHREPTAHRRVTTLPSRSSRRRSSQSFSASQRQPLTIAGSPLVALLMPVEWALLPPSFTFPVGRAVLPDWG